MPSSIPRIQITPSCQSHSDLLTYWAKLEGRSIGSLCSSLLEEAIYQAIESGRANKTAIQLMNNVIKNRERALEFTHQYHLQQEAEKSDQEYEQTQSHIVDNFSPEDREWYALDEKPEGVFTDNRWSRDYKEKERIKKIVFATKRLYFSEVKYFDMAFELLLDFSNKGHNVDSIEHIIRTDLKISTKKDVEQKSDQEKIEYLQSKELLAKIVSLKSEKSIDFYFNKAKTLTNKVKI